jgi:hypothetical protein
MQLPMAAETEFGIAVSPVWWHRFFRQWSLPSRAAREPPDDFRADNSYQS